ncbi:class I SAM-dependent DNA methyltransferase [Rhodococcus sp. BP-252]|uniref:class I SAM-dependent DNA methyltransferase n=1 Tax=unclassified Rhodococcus (in: high G+C Gram-positive bacteria) TaxID=192944 RepID=UPI001C9B468E|nr:MULTISPECIES: DNA methyltransferase [unclassified Rhodococcus (in: high G+C Gram-positive bacteria)]MBY6414430.1 class I SAM-dependent DNA methyltransferase [Rhodococcus sp. BP-320]MBY6419147.1 class I SAM-dependent DNA methyltransferase [Rhodococcus sp. BP-321]MBY6423991.1 class I SAM-dependent DNA methyltransferase [Rhodococcus sp. BP-324]MBY6429298.1 class I SAM-dependent DNA methyltransferase [Rhodococcus sp. BP-323]MBY6434259.1 class I SAM-dependent DNA methyltransferase [Rhodococcus s
MTDNLVSLVEQHLYQELFLHDLNWSAPDHPPVAYTDSEGQTFTASNVSSYKGLRVWVCDEKPGSKVEAELDRLIAKTSTDRLVIFHNNEEQVWRWPARRNKDDSTSTRLTSHRHRTGTANPKFATRLDAIRLPIDVVLDANAVLTKVRNAFDVESQNETRRASKLMARMYAAFEKAYPRTFDPKTRDHEISVSLARILFLMFGDDTDMWETDAFRSFIHHDTPTDGSTLADQLNDLFVQLDTPDGSATQPRVTGLPYVNGGIFREKITLPALDKEFRDAVLDACAVDWSTISPAIFGSMFQSVRDAKTRRELGEHYTSELNILRTLDPLFLDELRSEFDRARTMKDEKGVLTRLWNRLGEIRFMDPACGCGNFIIVAYRELRDLELRIMERLQEITGDTQLAFDPTLALKVTLDHFYGIEIDEWPARIAETAMFLIDRQCDLKLKERFGDAPKRLPIQMQAQIVVGNALRLSWSEICQPSESVIVAGNPPFVGPKERTVDQTKDLKSVWGTGYDGFLDYVAGWYSKASDYFGVGQGEWAFVSTNSISQGQAVPTLWGKLFSAEWRIKFAHRTFAWTSEASGGAAVHCVIVGFSRNPKVTPLLIEHGRGPQEGRATSVPEINAYLVDGPNLLVTKRMHPLSPGLPEVDAGSKAVDWGGLTIEPDQHDEINSDHIAKKYIRRYWGGDELINKKNRWCLWFVGASLEDLYASPVLKVRLKAVEEKRLASTKAATRRGAATPHLFEERRQPMVHYLGIPQTFTENRLYATVARLAPDVIASIKLFTSPDPEGYLFAIISSSMFMTWQKTVGGRMKSDPSFTNTIVWNTLPLPVLDEDVREKLISAGNEILAVRENYPELSLAELYDPDRMPSDLAVAHQDLDHLVDRAFGAPNLCKSERERQRILFARYEELTSPLLTQKVSGRAR